jgi:6,7-dimethyl-8-ribityllumazine synthase
VAKELKGNLSGQGLRIGIVVGKFNEFVTHRLLEGARDALSRHGVAEDDVTVAWVPGSFEIPLVARTMAQSGKYDALVCLGAVIRGETAHFEHVAAQAASGVARASQDTGVPVMFGILTTENMEQAINRAGGKAGNHGYDWAVAAIEMATLMRQIKGRKS